MPLILRQPVPLRAPDNVAGQLLLLLGNGRSAAAIAA
jgi:hypothetical protein